MIMLADRLSMIVDKQCRWGTDRERVCHTLCKQIPADLVSMKSVCVVGNLAFSLSSTFVFSISIKNRPAVRPDSWTN